MRRVISETIANADNQVARHFFRRPLALAAGLLASGVAGCALPKLDEAPKFGQPQRTAEEIRQGKEHFVRGQFGLSEKYYRSAVERYPKDPEAWLGLAASYDQLARFKLADRSYKRARALIGETPALLNNMGYSQMLRGDLGKAKRYLVRAQQQSPGDVRITSNIEELNVRLEKIGREPIPL